MYLLVKRFFDIVVSLFLIVLITPLLLGITLLLMIFNKGEVLYLQQRIGYKNNSFGIYKFSTMLKDSHNLGGGKLTLGERPTCNQNRGFFRINQM